MKKFGTPCVCTLVWCCLTVNPCALCRCHCDQGRRRCRVTGARISWTTWCSTPPTAGPATHSAASRPHSRSSSLTTSCPRRTSKHSNATSKQSTANGKVSGEPSTYSSNRIMILVVGHSFIIVLTMLTYPCLQGVCLFWCLFEKAPSEKYEWGDMLRRSQPMNVLQLLCLPISVLARI